MDRFENSCNGCNPLLEVSQNETVLTMKPHGGDPRKHANCRVHGIITDGATRRFTCAVPHATNNGCIQLSAVPTNVEHFSAFPGSVEFPQGLGYTFTYNHLWTNGHVAEDIGPAECNTTGDYVSILVDRRHVDDRPHTYVSFFKNNIQMGSMKTMDADQDLYIVVSLAHVGESVQICNKSNAN